MEEKSNKKLDNKNEGKITGGSYERKLTGVKTGSDSYNVEQTFTKDNTSFRIKIEEDR